MILMLYEYCLISQMDVVVRCQKLPVQRLWQTMTNLRCLDFEGRMQQTTTEAAAKPTLVAQSQGNDKSPRSRVVQNSEFINDLFTVRTIDCLLKFSCQWTSTCKCESERPDPTQGRHLRVYWRYMNDIEWYDIDYNYHEFHSLFPTPCRYVTSRPLEELKHLPGQVSSFDKKSVPN